MVGSCLATDRDDDRLLPIETTMCYTMCAPRFQIVDLRCHRIIGSCPKNSATGYLTNLTRWC